MGRMWLSKTWFGRSCGSGMRAQISSLRICGIVNDAGLGATVRGEGVKVRGQISLVRVCDRRSNNIA